MHAWRRRPTGTPLPSALGPRASCTLAAVFALLILHPSLPAGDSPRPSAQQDVHDVRIAVRARRVLSQDAELVRLNVGVSVRDGNVTLWGRVPNEAQAQRAVQRVRKLQGVFTVRSELRIEPVELERDDMPTLPVQVAVPSADSQPAGRAPRPPGVLAGNPKERESERPSLRDAARIDTPIPMREPPVTLLKPRPVEKAEGVEKSVERVIRSDVRFAAVRSEVEDGVVTLRGTVTLMEHAMELARQVSRLPGVESVLVEQVRVAPNR